MQWYKGNHKIAEGAKYTSKYIELGNDEYEVLLEISVSSSLRFGILPPDPVLFYFQRSKF